jgi:hypothetical protein
MPHQKLQIAATTVVAEYMGIAAQFVVEDAMDDMLKNKAFSNKAELQQLVFFSCLGKQLPPEVPYEKVKQAILKLMGS